MAVKISKRDFFILILACSALVFAVVIVLKPTRLFSRASTDVNSPSYDLTRRPWGKDDENLLSNGDFESDNFGTIRYWSETSVELNKWYLTQDPDNQNGSRMSTWVKFAFEKEPWPGSGIKEEDRSNCNYYCDVSVLQIVPAEEGITYRLSASARVVNGTGSILYLDFLNAYKTRIKVYTQSGYGQTNWSREYVEGIAPVGTKYVRVILYSGNTAVGMKYWDNVLLEKLN